MKEGEHFCWIKGEFTLIGFDKQSILERATSTFHFWRDSFEEHGD